MDYFIGVGHGRRSDGTYDPGAVYGDLTEHVLAHAVVGGIDAGLTRSGVARYAEQDSGAGHDPNWSGSARTANRLQARRAVEVHFNASATHRGSGAEAFHWPGNALGARLAADLAATCARRLGISNRGPKDGSHLGFIRITDMTAVLLEVAFIDHPTDAAAVRAADLHALGDALALELAQHLGQVYEPPPPVFDPKASPIRTHADAARVLAYRGTMSEADALALPLGTALAVARHAQVLMRHHDRLLAGGH